MNAKYIMFLAFCFISFTLVSRVMEGAYFNAGDVALLNDLTVIRSFSVFNWFSIPVLNMSFFTVGLPKLIQWDYPFFGGGYEVFRYMLYTFSIGVVFGLFTLIIVLASQFIRR